MKTPRRFTVPYPIVAAVVATMVLLGIYLSTAAPDLTFWDASELMTAAHTMGIPHPPGTPLWVLLGKLASMLFSSAPPPRAITLLSVWSAALTGGAAAYMAAGWIGARGAVVAAVSAGTMLTVWNNATETEVYALSLLASVLLLVTGEYAGRPHTAPDQARRARAGMAFVCGLALPLHLTVLVALPASIAFAWRGPRPTWRDVLSWMALAALGVSAIALLPLFSVQNPTLDSGNPESWQALIAVLQREQYAVSGLWPRMAPLWLQLGNVFQWADWQVAYGLHPFPTAHPVRTSLTVLWAWLAVLGLRRLWRHDARVGRAMLLLVLSASFGVAFWLNMRAGPTFGAELLPTGTPHEARERDYFFVLAFWGWGVLAGVGLSAIAGTLGRRLPAPVAMLPLALVVVPLLANREVADRSREPVASLPRTYARLLLDAVPRRGVLFAGGDNDSFPLWYLQQVEDYRPDITVVTVPLLGAQWYREQLAAQQLLAPEAVRRWPGHSAALRSLMIRAEGTRRAVRVSTLLGRTDREQLDPTRGWALQGLVYAPDSTLSAGGLGLDLPALRQQRALVPLGAFLPLPPGADPAAQTAQELLQCVQVSAPADSLLVSRCGGA